MAIADGRPGRLTPRGLATRERILEAAADLIYAHGVHATNNELVRKAAGVSGSQLSHYFPDKESLVRAVISWRADSMMGLRDSPPRGPLDSFEALRAWADSYVQNAKVLEGGCSFGSLASEIMKTDLDVHDEIAAGFDRWREVFRSGLQAMRDRHDLRRGADPDRLASVLMAAFQGGMLLTQAARDVTPLREALYEAIAHVESYARRRTPA
ncbi:TetR/AcrR family transcriptional regulator [Actinoallomurus bryophytorum]|uniref:TetR family transcriptional regulator n=1 Tax=Actinoallomurus bryophytorum TaxID=1490222 RepID=A0A543CH78_9ACTN|nr:TetR/AcrR family transcriptional regulator [Actinoallomurus bryophytorum]TQL96459.1 TetR family transcriptional regulator [Actinoallomurus bryophytorum]